MWQILMLSLRRQRRRNVLAGGGFFLAACALILLTATTQSTVIQANQIISQNWRPAYDLVVLPSQAKTPTGKVIPSDSIAGYGGGISIQQYQQIQQIPGVEVAAPIAYLGYVQLPPPFVAFSGFPLQGGFYRLDWTLTASNGKQSFVEQHQSFMYDVPSSCDGSTPLDSNTPLTTALAKQNILSSFNCNGGAPSEMFEALDTGPASFAAIDPAAENQLVHLNEHITGGQMPGERDTLQPDPNYPPAYRVPVLLQQHVSGQVGLHATFSYVTGQNLTPQQLLARGGFNYLAHLPGQRLVVSHNVPTVQDEMAPILKEGGYPGLYWDGHTWQAIYSLRQGNALTFLYRPSGLTYQPAQPPGGQYGPAYTLVPTGQQGPEAAFRTLTPLQVAQKNLEYQPTGTFNSSALAAQFSDPLNWLPETTYTASPVQVRYDAQGHPVTPTNIEPTTNPAGFTLQPPSMLTTLAAAQRIVGNNLISVIRVRVAGVSSANQASWNHAAQVAQQIRQRTGLRVLVTLGSSPQPMLVYVPGFQARQHGATNVIPALGWAEERWIYTGAALLYLAQSGATRLLFITAILFVCLGYLVVTFNTLVVAQRREFAVLNALGWRPWQPIQLFLGQTLFLSLGGGVMGTGAALLIAALIGATPIWLVVIWTLPAVLLLALLGTLYPLWLISRIRPADGLRAGATITRGKTRAPRLRFGSLLPPLAMMALRNLARQRLRALIAAASIFFSALLLVTLLSGLQAFRQVLHGTLLGDYVLFQTQIPQIAGAVFVVVLSFLSVADLMLLQVHERQQEIGLLQAVGWRSRLVHRLFLQEGLVLGLLGALPGTLLALGILAAQHITQGTIPVPIIALGVLLLMVVVAGFATLPAMRAADRLPVIEVLRAE